uniref:Solute carrier organic anion transporter family member n=1 Tax=Lepisosteus oculatus TaxID=7918 RepID=W5MFK3_LEPOC|nr:PREDICTED: solute carrier organic anion transporter family member 4A1 isoform X1 [Lepisosteus oculatus]XP_015220694.1 PREDICTED: solute carrier organic anion transporter family member 4A1 isoform X1 [Lepisosteus oculatus]XP_015220695.1 PREDICTED: solute carrier organic anion transporter family member 4A1 isoform X1 [Lepisosteus oculatus]XP_015220696.1 PREDICTED: solute carrier organic anion transporter family member 4A1 isoform X1 [Lepisosteus oculatus]XP_015220697.1 PREDICTED: solute carrie
MPNLLNTDTSFSSKQELLDLNDSQAGAGDLPLQAASPLDGFANSALSDTASPTSADSPGGAPGSGAGEYGEDQPYGFKFVPTETEQLCGWGALTPRFIQAFNTPKWVLFFLCVASFLQGMIVNGFINTVITSIERRFDLRSYQSGLIASSYDIAACICLTFVSYFGGTGHKPKWLGWGVLVMALGSLVFSLPHFVTDSYKVTVLDHTGLCSDNQTTPCQESSSSLSSYRYMFMLGQFLHGMGATPLYTLGVTYLDENVKSNYAPVYIGIFYTAAIVGPAAGYLLGGFFLNMYTEIHETTELTPENPLWVGAWWIGFLVGGAASLLVSIPILGYPRQLPGSQRYVAMRVSEAHQLKDGSQETALDPQFGKTVKDMPRSVLLLLKNPTFIFLCFAGATEATLIAGMSTFGPKFLESQFSLSASEAATWFGYMVVPAGGGGTFLGGYIVKKLNLRCRGIIKFCMFCGVISLLAIFIFLIHCPNMPMAGVNAPYFDSYSSASGGPLNLTVGCNSECSCAKELYNPVCGADGTMYYSPCHAGCSGINQTLSTAGKKVYSGCRCIVGNLSSWEQGVAEAGKCTSSCQYMPVFLVFLFIVILFTFLCSIPALTATLRCVPDSQRSFGLGIQWIVVRTLGGIPGPIAFGSVIDISCLLWQDQCGEQGSCYLYQNSAMSRYTLIAGIIYKALGTLFFFLAAVLYSPPPESPQSSRENTDQSAADKEDEPELPEKAAPQEILQAVNTKL